ncbi:metal-dependent hydrolase [Natronosalvus caseinilyticus]|uniref:metal-dependent hydrolase n=1 Tax=Natronosalvus caseinilyticus TaxID=2953747 RepID=UPI0028B057FC|nr:metal-dependent hydrolase [Natronosalvus caseinilyticus]
MVEPIGHGAMALLFAVPAWILWGRRPALTFAALTQVTALLPDVDLLFDSYFSHPQLQHHGLTHTVPFVLVVGLVFGAVAARTLTGALNAHRLIRSDSIAPETTFVFATSAFWAGGLSHIFVDLLSSAPHAAMEPFWPVYSGEIVINVVAYDSTPVNVGLVVVALVTHVALYRAERYPYETRWSVGS